MGLFSRIKEGLSRTRGKMGAQMDELVEKMVHKIQNWEKSNKVVETIIADVERKISDDSKKIQ